MKKIEYIVQREVLDELRLDEVAQKRTWTTKPTLGERLRESLSFSVLKLKQILFSWFPVLGWLPHYPIREYAVGDVMSGCSVGIMHLPQGMAYALLASLRPVFGLYTSFYPVLVYFIFGTSRHISVGTFAVISIMIGSVTERLAPDSDFIVNGTNGTGSVDIDERDAYRVQIACSLTVLTGIFQILLGVVRFGFVVTYLSEPLVRGYTTGSACHVCVSQLKYLFGVTPARFSGPLSLIYVSMSEIIQAASASINSHHFALVVSLVALAVLIVVKELNTYYRKKLPLPIPIELIVIIAATMITHFCGLPDKYDIDVVGEIPSGLKAPRVPDATLFSKVIGDAFAVAIVGYAINISLGKTFALKHGYKVDSNQELVALGLSNTVGGFFQCYSVTSSLSRSLVQESTGGKTQVAGLVSSIIVLITVLKIGSLFEDLPKAVLSTIVFVNLKGMFKQFMDVPMLWRTNKVDLLVWLVTFTSTILFNLDLGLAISIGFSMLTIIFRTQLPRYSILGNVPGTELYLDTNTYQEVRRMLSNIYTSGALANGKLSEETKGQENITVISLKETAVNGFSKGQVNRSYHPDTTMSDSDSDTGCHGNEENEEASGSHTQSIILDLSTTSFVDTVTVKTLKNVRVVLSFFISWQLEKAGFFSESIPKSRLFITVHDAVLHILKKRGEADFVLVIRIHMSDSPLELDSIFGTLCQLLLQQSGANSRLRTIYSS
uniref:Solute carrier family 26 member 6-like n=1 Tax=Gouania willdenowi TaxID=441366 RepID=A0A8C5G9M0_GOUWI